ncbi:MAG: glutathione S-transferase family protein [Burkholderiales bacterium]
MNKLQFYSADVCPFAHRVRLALHEKVIAHELISVDLENIPDWYYEISPTGRAPLLKQGDQVIWESTVINEFLEDAYPERPLLPSDPVSRAHARIWIQYCNSTFQPNFCGLVFELDESKHEGIRAALRDSLKDIEAGLAKTSPGPYWLGEELTLVDLTYYPFFEQALVLAEYRAFEMPQEHSNLNRWLDAMKNRVSVQDNRRDAGFYIKAYKPYMDGTIGK